MTRLRTPLWQTLALRYKPFLGGFSAILLLLIIWKIPQWQARSWEGQIELKDMVKLENDARTTLVQALGGAALLIGLFFTWRNLQITQETATKSQEFGTKNLALAQESQITEHFTRAIDQLGSDKLQIRLGGIYALEQIARVSDKDYWPIMEVLTGYVRANAPRKEEGLSQEETSSGETQLLEPAIDIQAVLTVLGRRRRSYGDGTEDRRLNLRGTDLRGADLAGIDLSGAYLDRADLSKAHLYSAHLVGAFLKEVRFLMADLRGANLLGAHLDRAHLRGAAIFANVSEAEFMKTDLRGTNLSGADGLTRSQVADAITDETTVLPQDLL